jgi:hypothetical protein
MTRTASLALLLLALCVSVCARGAAADEHPLLRVLNAASRDASRAAAGTAASAHTRRALLLSHARHAARRRLVATPTDAAPANTTQVEEDDSCGRDLPCMLAMSAQQGNQSMFAVTDAALCPFQQADTDACYYVRCTRRCARCHRAWAPTQVR